MLLKVCQGKYSSYNYHQFWRPFFSAPFTAFHVHRVGIFYWLACRETAVGTGWSAAGGSRSASTYRARLVARGDHGVDVWADGEMSRGGEGNGDGRQAAAFISWKLIPPFVHFAPSDKMGRLRLWCPVFSFFSPLSSILQL